MSYDILPIEIKSKIIYMAFGIYHEARQVIKNQTRNQLIRKFYIDHLKILFRIRSKLNSCAMTEFETIDWLVSFPGIRYQIKHNSRMFLNSFCIDRPHTILGDVYKGVYNEYKLINYPTIYWEEGDEEGYYDHSHSLLNIILF